MRTSLAILVAIGLALPASAHAAPISSAAQLFTCCTPEALQDRYLAEAEASGAEYVRVDVELHGIFGSEGSPDWTHLDRLIELSRRHDVKLLGIIRGTPTWLSECPDRTARATLCAPRDAARWGDLAGRVAAHARGAIDHWEILNEPDARWAFTGSAEDYARMLSASYDAIKARAPGAQVVFGGVERPREHDWITRVFATPNADAAQKFDIAAVHLRVRLRNEVGDLGRWLIEWRQLLQRYGFDGPLWVTEHGYPADPAFQWDAAYRGSDAGSGAAAQAEFLRRSIRLLSQAGAAQVFVTLRDNLYGEYLSEGIEHIDESQPGYPVTRRPAFGAVRDLAITWDPVVYRRSGAEEQRRQARQLERLALSSAAAGRPIAAAVQAGAAEGRTEIALELVRAAAR